MAKSAADPDAPRKAPRRSRAAARPDVLDPAATSYGVVHADEASQPRADPAHSPRFRIFIVDCGWNSPARRALHDNFHLIRDLHKDSPIYLLGRERSLALMRRFPELVGSDPIIRVHCEVNRAQDRMGFHGFRLHLGLLKRPEQALQALQKFARFIAMHRHSTDLEADMRKRLRQEGLQGALEIIMHGEAHGVSI